MKKTYMNKAKNLKNVKMLIIYGKDVPNNTSQ